MNVSRDVALRERYLRDQIGPEPLAVGAFEWPDLPATVDEVDAIPGWRVWRVADDGRYVPPFRAPTDETPGWNLDGLNTYDWRGCELTSRGGHLGHHPGCTCGLRAVQSQTVADSIAYVVRTHRLNADGWMVQCREQDIPLAVGQVACFGRIAPGTIKADDWPHTLRAEFMVSTERPVLLTW